MADKTRRKPLTAPYRITHISCVKPPNAVTRESVHQVREHSEQIFYSRNITSQTWSGPLLVFLVSVRKFPVPSYDDGSPLLRTGLPSRFFFFMLKKYEVQTRSQPNCQTTQHRTKILFKTFVVCDSSYRLQLIHAVRLSCC